MQGAGRVTGRAGHAAARGQWRRAGYVRAGNSGGLASSGGARGWARTTSGASGGAIGGRCGGVETGRGVVIPQGGGEGGVLPQQPGPASGIAGNRFGFGG